MNHCPERISNLIREYLGELIVRELEFPGALVTLTDVDVDKNMDIAKVGVSVVPSAKSHEALRTLTAAQGELQHKLLLKLNIKPMPRIHFFIDHGSENAAHIEKILIEEDNQ